MLLDDEGKNKTYNMKKEADSMKKKADSMKKKADSMKKEADSMKKEADSMKKETDSMKEKDELEECLVCFDTISNKKYVVCKLLYYSRVLFSIIVSMFYTGYEVSYWKRI